MFDLYDFVQRLGVRIAVCNGGPEFLNEYEDDALKEAVFVLTVFHHKVSNGIWEISPETSADLQVLMDWIGKRIL